MAEMRADGNDVTYLRHIKALIDATPQADTPCPWCGHSGPIDNLGDHLDGCPMEAVILDSMDEIIVEKSPRATLSPERAMAPPPPKEQPR